LIIDNHAELVKQIETRLSYEEDFKICMVAPLCQLTEGLLECNPDVLLIDPYSENSYKYDRIKMAMDVMPSLTVVVWTAVVDTAMLIRLKKQGVHCVLEKGISSSALVDALRGVVDRTCKSL
jgi:DNA-binding NarL/FixJ family response regulator